MDIPTDTSLPAVHRIAQRFASLPLDLTDASIAEAAARLGIHRIISIDADFDVYRDPRGKALVNLLRRKATDRRFRPAAPPPGIGAKLNRLPTNAFRGACRQ